jgi:hypothetical protein
MPLFANAGVSFSQPDFKRRIVLAASLGPLASDDLMDVGAMDAAYVRDHLQPHVGFAPPRCVL